MTRLLNFTRTQEREREGLFFFGLGMKEREGLYRIGGGNMNGMSLNEG